MSRRRSVGWSSVGHCECPLISRLTVCVSLPLRRHFVRSLRCAALCCVVRSFASLRSLRFAASFVRSFASFISIASSFVRSFVHFVCFVHFVRCRSSQFAVRSSFVRSFAAFCSFVHFFRSSQFEVRSSQFAVRSSKFAVSSSLVATCWWSQCCCCCCSSCWLSHCCCGVFAVTAFPSPLPRRRCSVVAACGSVEE